MLKTLLSDKNLITIRDNTFMFLGAVAFRQLLLLLGGLLLPVARKHGLLEVVAVVLLIAGVAGYGQYKSWRIQREAKRMADALPDSLAVVVRKGDK